MKAEDLMIGDFIQHKITGETLQITEILSWGVKVKEYDDAVADSIDILPIPLTPEILEKNGFKIDKNETYCKRYFFACNLGKVPQTVVEFSFYGEGVSADTLFKCWTKPKSCDGENSIHICDLKSVHELQHAIRLCGIDKTIEL